MCLSLRSVEEQEDSDDEIRELKAGIYIYQIIIMQSETKLDETI